MSRSCFAITSWARGRATGSTRTTSQRLVADDWGLWRTATGTLDRVAELRPDVAEPALQLRRALDEAPKGRKFRMRARVGERVRWYEPPDEVE